MLEMRRNLGKSAGSIGDGSGHIPTDGTAADGLIPSNSIFAPATLMSGWSWRSATSDAATSSHPDGHSHPLSGTDFINACNSSGTVF
jgi:hypothetical protein